MDRSAEFAQQFGNDAFDRVFSVLYGDASYDDISITNQDYKNAINQTFEGTITVNDEEWYFSGRDGNNDGSVIEDFGQQPIKRERTITRRMYVPNFPVNATDEQRARMQHIYDLKRKAGEYDEMERKMNYDHFFSPTLMIEKHYKEWGLQRGLQIDFETIRVD